MSQLQSRSLRALRRALLGVILTCGAAWSYHHFTPEIYEARVQLKVPDFAEAAAVMLTPELRICASRILAEQAGEITPEESQNDFEDVLSGQLRIDSKSGEPRQPGEMRLELAYHTSHRERAVTELTAIADAYLAREADSTSAKEQAELRELEQQTSRLKSTRDEQLGEIKALDANVAARTCDEASRAITLERVKILSRHLAEARSHRLGAENQLRQLKRALQQNVPLELVIAGLENGVAKELAKTILDRSRMTAELSRRQASFEQLAAVYGRRHPQLINLQQEIDDLLGRVMPVAAADDHEDSSAPLVTALLEALQEDLARRQTFEQDLLEQVELERSTLNEHLAVETERTTARERLAETESQLGELEQQLAARRQVPHRESAQIIQKPWLNPEAVSPSLSLLLLIGTGCGCFLGILSTLLSSEPEPARVYAPREANSPMNSLAALPLRSSLKERRELRIHHLRERRVEPENALSGNVHAPQLPATAPYDS